MAFPAVTRYPSAGLYPDSAGGSVPDAGGIVSLADAKAFLNITSDASDDELAGFISAASTMWENRVGPVAGGRTYSEWYDGGGATIVLRHAPVQSVLSVHESFGASVVYTLTEQTLDSGTVDAWGFSVDLTTGMLTRRVVGITGTFAGGWQNVHVTYTAGYDVVPADIRQAVCLLVQHMWETQRGGTRMAAGSGGEAFNVARSYTWPRRVEEIAAGYYVPGIA